MKLPSQVKTKNVVAIVLIAILFTTIMSYFTFAQSSASTFTISPGIYPGAPSYTIEREGDNYFAKDANGLIAYSSPDASTVIQSAINTLGSRGGKILLKSGVYSLTAPLIIQKHYVELEGEGYFAAYLDGSALSDYAIQVGNATTNYYFFTIRNLGIKGGCKITNVSFFKIDKCRFTASGANKYNLHIIEGCHYSYITYSQFSDGDLGCILIEGDNNPLTIIGNSFDKSPNAMLKWVKATGTVQFGVIAENKFESVVDKPARAIWIQGLSQYMNIIGNQIGGYFGTYPMLELAGIGANRCVYFNIVGNVMERSDNGSGIVLEDARDVVITNNVIHCKSGGYAIVLKNTSIRNIIANNRIVGNFSIAADATPNIIKGNYGYVTENSGTVTITSSTSVTFDHGLAGTPTLVLASFNSTAYGAWTWTATSTQITITVTNSGTYTVYWYAEYKP